ncbi:TIGR04255 family protein [Prolixibacteraceae bacterium Z1-6]|uniref:TIGR04255 family protein n=1 Tax=Draconibacterium aestuarii TaxID=2998507 RepID=A0A9X3F789_9BACT|nr:TIGR04255 family protein [Prolixibacteraceae bacterium Z1-6]
MANRTPEKIDPCPIIDAVFEIRFISSIPPSAIFGIIYNSFKDEYKKVENLPISQLPEPVRNSDPSLRFKPLYRILNEDSVIQVGPNVFTVSALAPYQGWNFFSSKIYSSISKVIEIGCMDSVTRLGLRYINFFPENILNNIDLNISISGEGLNPKNNTLLRTEIGQDPYTSTLQITNQIEHNGKSGSIIDIDTFTTNNLVEFMGNFKHFIELAHSNEKELFFSLLKDAFLEKFNPKY